MKKSTTSVLCVLSLFSTNCNGCDKTEDTNEDTSSFDGRFEQYVSFTQKEGSTYLSVSLVNSEHLDIDLHEYQSLLIRSTSDDTKFVAIDCNDGKCLRSNIYFYDLVGVSNGSECDVRSSTKERPFDVEDKFTFKLLAQEQPDILDSGVRSFSFYGHDPEADKNKIECLSSKVNTQPDEIYYLTDEFVTISTKIENCDTDSISYFSIGDALSSDSRDGINQFRIERDNVQKYCRASNEECKVKLELDAVPKCSAVDDVEISGDISFTVELVVKTQDDASDPMGE